MQSNDHPPEFIGDDPMLTAREVARMLGLCTAQIHKMAQRGELPSYRFGHARRFLRSEVLEARTRFKQQGSRSAPHTMTRQQAEAYREAPNLERHGRSRRKT